jgi:hypothetical protein
VEALGVAAIAGSLALACLIALILMSRRLGKVECELDDSVVDLQRFKNFQDATNAPLPDTDEGVEELLRDR